MAMNIKFSFHIFGIIHKQTKMNYNLLGENTRKARLKFQFKNNHLHEFIEIDLFIKGGPLIQFRL